MRILFCTQSVLQNNSSSLENIESDGNLIIIAFFMSLLEVGFISFLTLRQRQKFLLKIRGKTCCL